MLKLWNAIPIRLRVHRTEHGTRTTHLVNVGCASTLLYFHKTKFIAFDNLINYFPINKFRFMCVKALKSTINDDRTGWKRAHNCSDSMGIASHNGQIRECNGREIFVDKLWLCLNMVAPIFSQSPCVHTLHSTGFYLLRCSKISCVTSPCRVLSFTSTLPVGVPFSRFRCDDDKVTFHIPTHLHNFYFPSISISVPTTDLLTCLKIYIY